MDMMDDSMEDTKTASPFSHGLEQQHAQSLPGSPYNRSISPSLMYQPPHYLPPLGYNLAGSPPPPSTSSQFDSPRFISRNSLYSGSISPEQEMRMTPPPEATFGRVEFNDRSNSNNYEESSIMRRENSIPKGKPGFKVTMGYRADCPRCLAHEPGHYQHLEPII